MLVGGPDSTQVSPWEGSKLLRYHLETCHLSSPPRAGFSYNKRKKLFFLNDVVTLFVP